MRVRSVVRPGCGKPGTRSGGAVCGARSARRCGCTRTGAVGEGALDTASLELSESDLDFLFTVDKDVWREEAALVPEHLNTFGEHTPKELWDEYPPLVQRLG